MVTVHEIIYLVILNIIKLYREVNSSKMVTFSKSVTIAAVEQNSKKPDSNKMIFMWSFKA